MIVGQDSVHIGVGPNRLWSALVAAGETSESVRRDDPRHHASVEWDYEQPSAVAVGER
jgi:hypothetical protein